MEIVDTTLQKIVFMGQLRSKVDVFDMCRTSYHPNEYAVALGQYGGGLFFIEIIKEESEEGIVKMVQNFDEVYFKNHGVCCVVEVRRGLMLVCVQGNVNIQVVSREQRSSIQQIVNPSGDMNFNSLQLYIQYDEEHHPYVFMKDETRICMINSKTFIAKKVCDSLYDNTGNNSSLLQFIERS